MIISHAHKFIFIKPTKVAGTSVEIALAKHCGPDDVITKITSYNKESDEDSYTLSVQNSENYSEHMLPSEIKKQIDEDVWENYHKVTIIRNPWDRLVSQYFWIKFYTRSSSEELQKRKQYKAALSHKLVYSLSRNFNLFIILYYFITNNRVIADRVDNYYSDNNGNPFYDYCIRFENLEEDYSLLCSKIGINYEPLPKTKTKIRKNKSYRNNYNFLTKFLVSLYFKKQITKFNYNF